METLSEAIARLEAAGFRDSFRPEGARLWAQAAERFFAPEALVVEEVVRFEGESDPDDEAILFALRSRSGDVRGIFTTGYGTSADPASAEIVQGLSRWSASHESGPSPARGFGRLARRATEP